MHQPAAHDFGTRGPGEVILEVDADPVALPEGKRADVRRRLGEFGDDRVVNVDGLSEMADQGLEEILPGAAGGAFDHRLEGAKVAARWGDDRRLARARRRPARFLTRGPGRVLFRDHEAPQGPRAADRNLLGRRSATTGMPFRARSGNKLTAGYSMRQKEGRGSL